MHIDWFVFFAQIVNFLILVYLLKKLLYGRILDAMDAREAKINATFDEAEKSREDAQLAAAESEKKLQSLNEEYETLQNKARTDAEAYHKDLMDSARQEVEKIQARWVQTVNAERDAFLHDLRRLAGVQIYAIARRVLKDLADEDLEEKIATVMVTRIQDLKDDEKTKFMESLKEGNRLIVQSAYEMPPGARKKLDDVVKRFIAADIEVEYERSPEVMTGFEMKTDGHKIAWSVNDYLNTLEENFIEALYAESREKEEIQSKEGALA
ncbi:MAG: hypothetical protein NT072_12500 [Deltaproteobacteria bacterium]|nr:hypothetical protein [Deltaproteobacteria bacterium]